MPFSNMNIFVHPVFDETRRFVINNNRLNIVVNAMSLANNSGKRTSLTELVTSFETYYLKCRRRPYYKTETQIGFYNPGHLAVLTIHSLWYVRIKKRKQDVYYSIHYPMIIIYTRAMYSYQLFAWGERNDNLSFKLSILPTSRCQPLKRNFHRTFGPPQRWIDNYYTPLCRCI